LHLARGFGISANDESPKGPARPDSYLAIMMDFQGAKLSSDADFNLMPKLEQRHGIIGPMPDGSEEARSASHIEHSLAQTLRR